MTEQNATKNAPPVFKDNRHGVHYDVWRKKGKYGPFYEVKRYKPYQDKQTGEWKKSHMLSDRDLLVAKEMEPKVLKEINRLQEQDREIAARYKADQQQEHTKTSNPEQSLQKESSQTTNQGYDHSADNVTLQEAKQEAQANKAYEQGHQLSAPSHEPSH